APQRSPLGRAGGGAPRGRARPGRRPRPPPLRSTPPRPTPPGEPPMLLGIGTSRAGGTPAARGDPPRPAPAHPQVRPPARPRPPRLRSTRPRPTRRGEPLMLLGIDTSGAVSTAVARGDLTGPAPEILQVRSDARSRHHDEVLLALIDETLQAAGAERRDLT